MEKRCLILLPVAKSIDQWVSVLLLSPECQDRIFFCDKVTRYLSVGFMDLYTGWLNLFYSLFEAYYKCALEESSVSFPAENPVSIPYFIITQVQ